MSMDFFESSLDPGDPGDQYKDSKNQEEELENKNTERKKENGAKPTDNKEKEANASMHEDDDDDGINIQFVYNNDKTQETWIQPNSIDFEAQADDMPEGTKDPSSKLTYISTDMCAYDDEDTQEADIDMKSNHEDHEEYTDHNKYQYHDTEMINEDLGFMNRTKK